MPADPSLITAAQSGDAQAMAHLLARAQPDIRRYAQYNCRNASDVEEAVQEVLILTYRRIASLRAVGAFSAWLMATVRRTCWRLARRLLGPSLGEAQAVERWAAMPAHDVRLDLAAAIQSLPDHYRSVILMRDVEELTINEIAANLSLSREAVKARLHRARNMIKDYLAG